MQSVPKPDGIVGLKGLRGIWRRRSVIGALEAFHAEMGDVFRLPLPGFSPVMLVGAEASRFLLVTSRDDVRWRVEREPITILLRHGVLVEDGNSHDDIRRMMNPALHKRMLQYYVDSMWQAADQISSAWQLNQPYNMLNEMRKVALLIMARALFGVDFTPELIHLWKGVIRAVNYISPGIWVLWRGFSHMGYNRDLRKIDDYLYRIIAERRKNPGGSDDLLGALIHTNGITDDLIRDQLMTIIIAGHDTSTASLTWALYLLGKHPAEMARAQAEVRAVLGDTPPTYEALAQMPYLKQVLNESLRLYPPIHLGSRVAAQNLEFDGYEIPAGMRILYSIYLTQRHPAYWENPDQFDPERFNADRRIEPYTFLPFGGGPRNCIGAAFAQVESKVVLARLLQRFDLTLLKQNVRPYMGATLEPRPGVMMSAKEV